MENMKKLTLTKTWSVLGSMAILGLSACTGNNSLGQAQSCTGTACDAGADGGGGTASQDAGGGGTATGGTTGGTTGGSTSDASTGGVVVDLGTGGVTTPDVGTGGVLTDGAVVPPTDALVATDGSVVPPADGAVATDGAVVPPTPDAFVPPIPDAFVPTPDAFVPPPPNQPPLAVADAPEVAVAGALVVLDGSHSVDPEGAPLTYTWAQTGGLGIDLFDPLTAQASFIVPQTRDTFTFQLTVTDPAGASDTADVQVLVGNHAPVALAGDDQAVDPGVPVTLDGSGSSDPDGDPITIRWQQIAGPPVILDNPLGAQPSFTAPDMRASVVFELTVSDGLVTVTDSVTINVANRPPVADAGPDRAVGRGERVTLNGSANDPDGDVVTLHWEQIGGVPVVLDDPTRPDPSFNAPNARASLVFQLVANDGATDSPADTVTIQVANVPPTAFAGDDQLDVPPGAEIVLNGSGEDLDGDPLTYHWSQFVGPAVQLNDVRAQSPHFFAPNHRSRMQFSLIVSDGLAQSRADSVLVSVGNSLPVANAGPDVSVPHGSGVTLNGSGSFDLDGDPLTWRWRQVAGTAVALQGIDGPSPTFTAPILRGPLTFELVVNDGFGDSVADTVVVDVLDAPPVANAGPDQIVDGNGDVRLDGTASFDPDNDPINYFWTQTAGTPVQLNNRDRTRPSFRAPQQRQALAFQLVVDDGQLQSPADEVVVQVRNHAPVAVISSLGNQNRVNFNTFVTLDGTQSYDLDNDPLSYTWIQTAGPAVALSDPHAMRPSIQTPDGNAQLEYQLVVNDGIENSQPVTIRITVQQGGG